MKYLQKTCWIFSLPGFDSHVCLKPANVLICSQHMNVSTKVLSYCIKECLSFVNPFENSTAVSISIYFEAKNLTFVYCLTNVSQSVCSVSHIWRACISKPDIQVNRLGHCSRQHILVFVMVKYTKTKTLVHFTTEHLLFIPLPFRLVQYVS